MRRALRLFPALVVMVCFVAVLSGQFEPGTRGAIAPTLLYISNWWRAFGREAEALGHTWSLAIEEQFYLIWPFVVRKRNPRSLVKLCAWIAVIALAIRIVMRESGASPQMVYEFTICRMDALVIGAGVACLMRIPSVSARAPAAAPWLFPAASLLALIGALITRAYERDSESTETIGQSILAVFFALILIASIVGRGRWNLWLQTLLSVPLLRSVGKYSYAMYVIHYPIIIGMEQLLPRFKAAFGHLYIIPFISLITLLSYAAAFVSYHALEKHFLRLKRWFVPTNVSGPDFETLQDA
jgi:peptidoglycan/LPS O-acetylase OafA/YrhL